jgi:hypothetical protein
MSMVALFVLSDSPTGGRAAIDRFSVREIKTQRQSEAALPPIPRSVKTAGAFGSDPETSLV